jgi:hypothetical protein
MSGVASGADDPGGGVESAPATREVTGRATNGFTSPSSDPAVPGSAGPWNGEWADSRLGVRSGPPETERAGSGITVRLRAGFDGAARGTEVVARDTGGGSGIGRAVSSIGARGGGPGSADARARGAGSGTAVGVRVTDGCVTDGCVTDGFAADGRVADACAADGRVADACVANGRVADACVANGRAADGCVADGRGAVGCEVGARAAKGWG